MNNDGICFLAYGKPPLPGLTVALHSLKKHYQGPICLFSAYVPEKFIEYCSKFVPDIVIDRTSALQAIKLSLWAKHVCQRCWNAKPVLHKLSPFERTVLYDCDHLFLSDFDLSIFDLAEKHELVCAFDEPNHEWNTKLKGRALRRMQRKTGRAPIFSERLHSEIFIPKANGGCVASLRTSTLPVLWHGAAALLFGSAGKKISLTTDEFSLAYVIQKCGGAYISNKWSVSPYEVDSDTIAIHFSGRRYSVHPSFANEVKEMLDEDFMCLRSDPEMYQGHDLPFDKIVETVRSQ